MNTSHKIFMVASLFALLSSTAIAQSSGIRWRNGEVLTANALQSLDNAKLNLSSLGKPGFAPKLNDAGQITDPVVGDVSAALVTYGTKSTPLQTLLSPDSSVQNSLGYSLLFSGDPTGNNRITPSVLCSGNNNFGSAAATGLLCFNANTNPAKETYVGQIAVNNVTPGSTRIFNLSAVKDAPSGSKTVDVSPAITITPGYTYTVSGAGIASGTTIQSVTQDNVTNSTTLTLSTVTIADIPEGSSITVTADNGNGSVDPVGLYVGIKNTPYSAPEWAANLLANDNNDGGGTGGVLETDLNNFNCDNPDPLGAYHTGSQHPRKTRTDGSACPAHVGLDITGIPAYTSSSALTISGVPNGTQSMWETGINMTGGFVIGSAEMWTETLASTMWQMRGTHDIGLDAHNANFHYGFANLPMDPVSGRLVWNCPDNKTCNAFTPSIGPQADGTLNMSGTAVVQHGTDQYHFGGLGIDVVGADGSMSSQGNDWSYLTWNNGKYSFNFTDETNLYTPLTIKNNAIQITVPVTSTQGLSAGAESHLSDGAFTDPDAGAPRDAKFGNKGIAVSGGTKTDTLTVSGQSGTAAAYACFDTSGNLYRSATACVSN